MRIHSLQRHRLCIIVLAAIEASSLPSAVGGQEVPVAYASRATGMLEVDGRFEDDAWDAAHGIGSFVQVDPAAGAPSRAPTDVRLLWNGAGLYIGAEMTEPDARTATRAEGLRRDFTYETSDVFGVLLDGFGDGRFAMAFMTTPDGVQRDLLVFDGRDADESWNGIWRVRTARTEGGWTVEMFIPWKTLRYASGEGWRVNFIREARAIQETSGWSPWHRGVDPWDMAFAGRLEGIAPPPPGVNAQIQPYIAGRSASTGSALFSDPTSTGDVGIDLKWAATPNTVLDLTYNMDFAQAEVDRQVVNLDRFPVFFPERRTFFLESAGLFDTGLDVISPFYSRRIGLDSEGRPVPVTAGARMTHRSTKSSAGALLLRQEGVGPVDGSVFGVGRYVRNIGATGRLGGMVATRHDQGLPAGASALNTVAAVDWFFRPTTNLFARGMVSQAQLRRSMLWAWYRGGGNRWAVTQRNGDAALIRDANAELVLGAEDDPELDTFSDLSTERLLRDATDADCWMIRDPLSPRFDDRDVLLRFKAYRDGCVFWASEPSRCSSSASCSGSPPRASRAFFFTSPPAPVAGSTADGRMRASPTSLPRLFRGSRCRSSSVPAPRSRRPSRSVRCSSARPTPAASASG